MHISKFLKIMFNKFEKSSIKYCILRNYESLPKKNKNRDIDILVNDFDIKKILKFLNKNFTITSFNERDYICSVFISGITDGKKDSLMLDFQTKLSWKGILYLDNEKVFKYSIKYKNNKLMNIPSSAHQALITFFTFYLLGGDLNVQLKKKHINQFKENKSDLIKLISSFSNNEFSNKLYNYVTLGDVNKLEKLLNYLRIKLFINNFEKHSFNIFLKIIRHYIFEIRMRFTPYPLKHISFLGLDGSGKSSLINNISKGIGERVYNIKQEHLKPNLFIRQTGKKVTHPHLKKPRNNFISGIKLFYWVYAYNYKNLNHRFKETTLILWDRYIDDISIDPLRYRLNLNKKTYNFFINLVPKPECTFIVDVQAKLAFKRKKELTISVLTNLRKKYLEKGKNTKNTFVINNSKNLNNVTKKIIKIITKVLNQKTKKQINFFLNK
jgi:thymidylate kinase